MNIEPTIVERVAVTPDNSVYLESEGMTPAQVTGSQLRNLTNREVVGELLYTRSAYWAARGANYRTRQLRDLSRAPQLAPEATIDKTLIGSARDHYNLSVDAANAVTAGPMGIKDFNNEAPIGFNREWRNEGKLC